MKRQVLENICHESGNFELVVHGIAKELDSLVENPVKNRDRLKELIGHLRHRTKEMRKHRDFFVEKVREQDKQIKNIIDGV